MRSIVFWFRLSFRSLPGLLFELRHILLSCLDILRLRLLRLLHIALLHLFKD